MPTQKRNSKVSAGVPKGQQLSPLQQVGPGQGTGQGVGGPGNVALFDEVESNRSVV